MAYPQTVTSRNTGYVPTGSTGGDGTGTYDSDRQEIFDGMILDNIDDHSSDQAEMQETTNPGTLGAESLAVSALGEIKRLRYVVERILNKAFTKKWYEESDADLSQVAEFENLLKNGSFENFSAGAALDPDHWLSSGTSVAIAQDTTDVQHGASAAKITAATGNAGVLTQKALTIGASENTRFRGATVIAGCWVKTSDAGVNIVIDDGVGTTASSDHTGGGTYEFLTVSRTLNASATKLDVDCNIDAAVGTRVATFDGCIVRIGSAISEFVSHRNDDFGTDLMLDRRNYITSSVGTDASHDIDFAVGKTLDSTFTTLIDFSTALTKQGDAAWAAGDAAGGNFAASDFTSSATWHRFVIAKADGTTDAGFDTSLTAANRPTGYTLYRYCGSFLTDGSSNIIPFTDNGDETLFDVPQNDRNTANPGTSAVATTLSVPTGIKVDAKVSVHLWDDSVAADIYVLVTSPDQTDSTPSDTLKSFTVVATTIGANHGMSVVERVRTDTSAAIRTRQTFSDSDVTLGIRTFGWTFDRRLL